MKRIDATVTFTVVHSFYVDDATFAKLDGGTVKIDDLVDETEAVKLCATTPDVEFEWDYTDVKPTTAKAKPRKRPKRKR